MFVFFFLLVFGFPVFYDDLLCWRPEIDGRT